MVTFVTCLLLGIVVYAYFGFPLLMWMRAKALSRLWKTGGETPSVSVVVICHNEIDVIARKIENIFSLNYPPEKIQLVIASDGSDDGTDDAIAQFKSDRRLVHLTFPRRGKIPAINDALQHASGEITVFTDANTELNPDALQCLVRHFTDPSIGCVAGNQVYTQAGTSSGVAAGESTYWDYDRILKSWGSQAGNAISATGALYAIRSELIDPVPSGVTDDFTISTGAICQGYRLIFDPEAIASEPVSEKSTVEFHRKVRVMTRGFRSLFVRRELFHPFRFGFYSLQLLSHKLLRRLVAIPLAMLLILTPWMVGQNGWMTALAVSQWTFYGLAILGCVLASLKWGKWKPVSIPYFFCLANVAAMFALSNFLFGRKIEKWNSPRSEPAPVNSQSPQPVKS